ncbi:MAG: hypothetical protein ABWZ98_04550 [Nakamurella sp.]
MGKKAVLTTVGAALTAVAAATALAFAVPAAAGSVTGQPVAVDVVTASSSTQDAAANCDRLKKIQTKREAAATRLAGDETTKGSIAWLTAKAAAASAAGDANLAKLYTDKAALRTQVLEPLKTVNADRAVIIEANCS